MNARRRPVRMALRVPERAVQQQCVTLLRTVGAKVYVIGTTRRRGDYPGTMQTPGIPDVFAFLPPSPAPGPDGVYSDACGLWLEVKAVGGRPSPEQEAFRQSCLDSGQAHVLGGLDELTAWLIAGGWLKADNVAHYRRPSTPCTEACLAEIDIACSVVARCSVHGRTHYEAKASRQEVVQA